MDENSPEQGGREGSVHLAASSSTISVTTKEARSREGASGPCEGTSKDTSNDAYGP